MGTAHGLGDPVEELDARLIGILLHSHLAITMGKRYRIGSDGRVVRRQERQADIRGVLHGHILGDALQLRRHFLEKTGVSRGEAFHGYEKSE